MTPPTPTLNPGIVCGTWRGSPAFVVPVRRRPLLVGFLVTTSLAVLFVPVAFLAAGAIQVFAGAFAVFFAYISLLNSRSLRQGAAWYLTGQEIVIQDGGGTLAAAWDSITGFTPVSNRGRVVGLSANVIAGAAKAGGQARGWLRVGESVGVPVLLRPQNHIGGWKLLEPLLWWCLEPAHRHLIGSPEGLTQFLAAATLPTPSDEI